MNISFRTLTRTLPLLASLALASTAALAQGITSELSATTSAESKFEVLQHSPVAFWHGMSRAQFEQRTVAQPDGSRVLAMGAWVFKAANAIWSDDNKLQQISVEFRSPDRKAVRAAFEAYARALGGVSPDGREVSTGTPSVPDLDFEMLRWKDDSGGECALVRLHSPIAAEALQGRFPAGLAAFAVKPGITAGSGG